MPEPLQRAVLEFVARLVRTALLGRLNLLREFYDQVLIPPAVWKEVVEQGQGRAGASRGREIEEPFTLGETK